MPQNEPSGGAPFAQFRSIFPLSLSAALSETPGWLAAPLVGLTLLGQGYSATAAGIVASLPAAGIVTMSAILPAIARRAGVVRTFYAAAALLVVSLLILVAASLEGSLWLWCVGSCGVGLAASMRWVLTDGFVNHIAVSGQRGRLLAFHETIPSCALGFGPLVASLTTDDPARGFLIAIAMTLIGTTLTLGIRLPEVKTGRAHFSDLTAGLRLAPAAFAVAFLCGVLEGVAAATVPLYAVTMGLSAATGALLAAASGFGNLLGQLPFGAFADQAGTRPAIRLSIVLAIAALLVLHPMMEAPIAAAVTMAIFGATAGALYTLAVMEAATVNSAEVSMLPLLAAIAVLYTVGDIAGPVLGGFVLDVAPPLALPAVFIAACILTLAIAGRERS